jgi:hypothetical protein
MSLLLTISLLRVERKVQRHVYVTLKKKTLMFFHDSEINFFRYEKDEKINQFIKQNEINNKKKKTLETDDR